MEKPKIGDIYVDGGADNYYRTVGENAEGKVETGAGKFLEDLIPKDLSGKAVFDLACGNGRHAEVFCERGARMVVAMDLNESMLEKARERKEEKGLRPLELVRADMDDLPIGNNSFDFIFSRFGLMYSGKMDEVVQNLGEALVSGGEMLLEVNVVDREEKGNDSVREPVPLVLSIGENKINIKNFPYSREEYLEAFEKAGLKVVVAEKFPADDLSVDESYPDRDKISFSYNIFKLKKVKI